MFGVSPFLPGKKMRQAQQAAIKDEKTKREAA